MESLDKLMERLRLSRWFSLKPPVEQSGLCSLSIDSQGFSIAYAQRKPGYTALEFCESVPCDAKKFPRILTELVNDYRLQNVNCTWVLSPDQYQLFTLEELPVQANEFQAAIRWKIKKLLLFPVTDAVIDSFPIPNTTFSTAKKSMSVVVAQASYLNPIASQINTSGLQLSSIDITELGLRNITSLYAKNDASIALIVLNNQTSSLMITRQEEFYLSRRFDWGLDLILNVEIDVEKTNAYLDRLALEIKRSFDYYQSHWRLAAPTKIILAPIESPVTDIAGYLSQRLSVPIQCLDLNNALVCKTPVTSIQQRQCLPVIGGALRKEIKNHAAN